MIDWWLIKSDTENFENPGYTVYRGKCFLLQLKALLKDHSPAKWPMLSSAGQQGIFFGASFPVRRLELSFVTLCVTLLQGSCHFRSNGGVALGSYLIGDHPILTLPVNGGRSHASSDPIAEYLETFIPTVRKSFSKPQLQGGWLSYSNWWLSQSFRMSNIVPQHISSPT